jgi:hypothetical protein
MMTSCWRAGAERIAVDGEVIGRHASVDQAAITSESVSVEKHTGDLGTAIANVYRARFVRTIRHVCLDAPHTDITIVDARQRFATGAPPTHVSVKPRRLTLSGKVGSVQFCRSAISAVTVASMVRSSRGSQPAVVSSLEVGSSRRTSS